MRSLVKSIEETLLNRFRPSFLSIHAGDTDEPQFIHVVVSLREFTDMPIDKRVALVYKCIADEDPTLLDGPPVIIETFSSTEMVDIFEYIK